MYSSPCRFACSLFAALLLAGVPAGAQGPARRRPTAPGDPPGRETPVPGTRVFEGVSRRGSLQEALDYAVAEALRSLPGADRMVRYRVREITGESGGIRGANIVRVSIELTEEAAGAPPPPEGLPRELTAAEIGQILDTELRVRPATVPRGGTATFELTVRNTGNQLITLPFNSSKQFDFEVFRAGKLVARWSNGRVFAQALSSATIGPGQSLVFTGRWDLRNLLGQPVPPGDYQVRGQLATSKPGVKLADEATIRVTAR